MCEIDFNKKLQIYVPPNRDFLLFIRSLIDVKSLILIDWVRLGPGMHTPHTLGARVLAWLGR